LIDYHKYALALSSFLFRSQSSGSLQLPNQQFYRGLKQQVLPELEVLEALCFMLAQESFSPYSASLKNAIYI
jgi:hypothetical protein